MINETAHEGSFWEPSTQRHSDGRLTLTSENEALLRVKRPITDEKTLRTEHVRPGEVHVYRDESDPIAVIEDGLPKTIFGKLSDDTRVSLLKAYGGNNLFVLLGQEFKSAFLIVGEHVTDRQVYTRLRCRSISFVAEPMSSQSGKFKAFGGGRIMAKKISDEWWIEFDFKKSLALQPIINHIILPCHTLASIALRREFPVQEIQIAESEESPWLTVHTHKVDRTPKFASGEILIHPSHINAARIADWIDLSALVDTLIHPLSMFDESAPIESQLIVLAAITEGIHKRIYGDRTPLDSLSRNTLKKARSAARRALREALISSDTPDPKVIGDHVQGVMAMLGKMTFVERLTELATIANDIDENLLKEFSDWPAAVQKMRNKLVHQLGRNTPENIHDPDEVAREEGEFDLKIALTYSLLWTLKLNLLLKANFPKEVIQAGLADHSPYEYVVANTAVHIRQYRRSGPINDES